MSLQTGRFP
jgi:hypothetical protein